MENNGNHRQTLGKKGEDIACEQLQNMGHTILERNWRCGHLEIDIISVDPEGIHFVEVKTRQKSIQAPPQENVDASKQKKLVKAALRYLHSAKGEHRRDLECNFDIIAITFVGKTANVEWIPQAFIPLYI
jgi:putative endonuclease